MKFEAYYMLAADQVKRRLAVTEQFSNLFSADWSLNFVDHTNHVECVRSIIEDDSYVLIAEDGVEFSPRSEECIRRCIDALTGRAWDIALTEVTFTDPKEAAKLFPPQEEMLKANTLQMHGLSGVPYTGSRCYLINKWSKHHFYSEISTHDPEKGPFDVFLADMTFRNLVKGFVIYPFPTSLDAYLPLVREIPIPEPGAQQNPAASADGSRAEQLARTLVWIETN